MALRQDGAHKDNRYKVFFSYARDPDEEFVNRLDCELRNAGIETWLDSRSIPYGEEWRQEIQRSVKQATVIVFLVSSQSIDSEYCKWELDLALSLGKKTIPLLRSPKLDEPRIPASIKSIIDSRHYLEVLEDSELDSKLPKLLSELPINWEWERDHNRYLSKSLDYKEDHRDQRHEHLLSSNQLRKAERWRESATLLEAERIVPEIECFLRKSREHVAKSNRRLLNEAQSKSDEFKLGIRNRNWNDMTQEIAELPRDERRTIYSAVIVDAIQAGSGLFGDHFFYLLGDLPRALKLQKSDWAILINSMLNDGLAGWLTFSEIADGAFTLPAFFAACDHAASTGEPTAPVSLPLRIASDATKSDLQS